MAPASASAKGASGSLLESHVLLERTPLLLTDGCIPNKPLQALLTSAQNVATKGSTVVKPPPVVRDGLSRQMPAWLAWRTGGDLLQHLPKDAESQVLAQLCLPPGVQDAQEDVRGGVWLHLLLGALDNVPKQKAAVEWIVVPAASKRAAVAEWQRRGGTETSWPSAEELVACGVMGAVALTQAPGQVLALPPRALAVRRAGAGGAVMLQWCRASAASCAAVDSEAAADGAAATSSASSAAGVPPATMTGDTHTLPWREASAWRRVQTHPPVQLALFRALLAAVDAAKAEPEGTLAAAADESEPPSERARYDALLAADEAGDAMASRGGGGDGGDDGDARRRRRLRRQLRLLLPPCRALLASEALTAALESARAAAEAAVASADADELALRACDHCARELFNRYVRLDEPTSWSPQGAVEGSSEPPHAPHAPPHPNPHRGIQRQPGEAGDFCLACVGSGAVQCAAPRDASVLELLPAEALRAVVADAERLSGARDGAIGAHDGATHSLADAAWMRLQAGPSAPALTSLDVALPPPAEAPPAAAPPRVKHEAKHSPKASPKQEAKQAAKQEAKHEAVARPVAVTSRSESSSAKGRRATKRPSDAHDGASDEQQVRLRGGADTDALPAQQDDDTVVKRARANESSGALPWWRRWRATAAGRCWPLLAAAGRRGLPLLPPWPPDDEYTRHNLDMQLRRRAHEEVRCSEGLMSDGWHE